MTWKDRRIWTAPLLLTVMVLSGCALPAAPPLSLNLTAADRNVTPDVAAPAIGPVGTVKESGEAERADLLRAVIEPLMAFSLSQEASIAAERQRAAAVIAKIDAYNAELARQKASVAKAHRWWPFHG